MVWQYSGVIINRLRSSFRSPPPRGLTCPSGGRAGTAHYRRIKKTGAFGTPELATEEGLELDREMSFRLDAVRRFAVRTDVQAFALFFFGDPKTDHDVGDLVGDERNNARPDDRRDNAGGLYNELLADRVIGADLVRDIIVDALSAELG